MTDSDEKADAAEQAGEDPERLLAEALRAQARSAPPAKSFSSPKAGESSAAELASDPGPLPSALGGPPVSESERTATMQPVTNTADHVPQGYGLLSGAGASSLERERAALDPVPTGPATPPPATMREPQAPGGRQISAVWVLALAILLGLAAGSVIGLLTLL